MARLTFAVAAAILAATVRAHFTLDFPTTIGFDDDKEVTGPCGGFTPDFSHNVSDFHVGGDNIALTLYHPQGNWLFRGVLGTTLPAADSDWSPLFPQVMQSGLGKFCEPAVSVPADWAGKQGLISVAVDAPDGLLFQCAAVKFVSGTATDTNKLCSNASDTKFSFTSDAKLTSLTADTNNTSSNDSATKKSGVAPVRVATGAASVAGVAALAAALLL